MPLLFRFIIPLAIFLFSIPQLHAQKQFGFDNRKPSGQPYWTPGESVKGFKVPPGWEVKLVAAEPDVVNPIAFTFDEKGRLWVLECFEYPKRTPKGKKPRDRIKIIEPDPKGGRPKVTVWAEGKDLPIGWDLATGLEVGHGGVFLGAPPYLFFIKDDNGKAGKQEILLKGFGSQDTHETLNTLQWGPDSKLYGLHGVFTNSEVNGVKMNAAVWRYDVHQKKFDIFAEGTSNPWGMDFDARGNCFLACCVIPHLFHMVPGGTYKRQAGASFNPYAYGLLNEICDHTHHKDSGWAHAGLLCMDGDHVPEPYRGSVLMGSIHGCSIKRDSLRPNGSTFIASCNPDFLTSADKNFRPINLRWGPDGSIYVIDWHDQNPCHQAPPDAWDYTHGRIYKMQRTGAKPHTPVDLNKARVRELVEFLGSDNPFWHRTALRMLREDRQRRVEALYRLIPILFKDTSEKATLRSLWAVHALDGLTDQYAMKTLTSRWPALRAWTIRLLGESGQVSAPILDRFVEMAAKDPSPQVRLQLASTAQRLNKQNVLPILNNLMKHAEDAKDPYLPLMIWLAYESRVTAQRNPALEWLKENAPGNPLVTNDIVPRTMRRLAATGKADDLEACVVFLGAVRDSAVRRQALDGLVQAFKNRQVDPPTAWKRVFAELAKDSDAKVVDLARRLAVHFQDTQAIARALERARDAGLALGQRLEALRDVALAHPPQALPVLHEILAKEKNPEIRAEACRALAAYDDVKIPAGVLAGWKTYPPLVRGEAVNLLSGRKPWAKDLLAAVGKGTVPRTDLTDNIILKIRAFKDKNLNEQIEKVWGRFRDTPKDLAVLIDKMRDELDKGRGSFTRGKVVFDNQCAKCHKFDGRGHDVGPNLDGAARDIEYLLANILDPNRVVGQPYYTRIIELKNGRIETGLLIAEDGQSVTLKGENDVVKVIQRKDIEGKILVQEKSIMPEGLANNITVQDFRDLIRYTMAHPFITEVKLAKTVTGAALLPEPWKASPEVDRIWKAPTVGPTGRISLPSNQDVNGIVYIAAEVTAPAPLRARLLLGAAHDVTIKINGKKVYSGKPGKQDAPDQAGVEVELQKGVNRIMIQVAYLGDNVALYARFLDPDRKLSYPEEKAK